MGSSGAETGLNGGLGHVLERERRRSRYQASCKRFLSSPGFDELKDKPLQHLDSVNKPFETHLVDIYKNVKGNTHFVSLSS